MATVYLGIGSNIGDRESNLKESLRRLEDERGVEVVGISSFYNTQPVGGPPQVDYLNGVISVSTGIPPDKLLEKVKSIEVQMGRRPAGKDFPRIIDIDILLYDNIVVDMDSLTIPHPRMHERMFVLKGLMEIAPQAVHPVLLKTVEELYEDIAKIT